MPLPHPIKQSLTADPRSPINNWIRNSITLICSAIIAGQTTTQRQVTRPHITMHGIPALGRTDGRPERHFFIRFNCLNSIPRPTDPTSISPYLFPFMLSSNDLLPWSIVNAMRLLRCDGQQHWSIGSLGLNAATRTECRMSLPTGDGWQQQQTFAWRSSSSLCRCHLSPCDFLMFLLFGFLDREALVPRRTPSSPCIHFARNKTRL